MPAPEPPLSSGKRQRDRRWLALLFVVAVLPYLGTLRADFTNWDDPEYLTTNPTIRGFTRANVSAWLTQDYVGNRAPVHLASYALDHAVWGLRPFGFHLTNVLLHGVVAVLLWRFLRRLGGPPGVTAAGVALFALHPAGVEVVAWVTERKTLLAACFMLGSALCYLRAEGRAPILWAGMSALLFALGMMSKIAIAPFPLVLLVLHRCGAVRINRARAAVVLFGLVVAVTGGLLTVRVQASLEAAGRIFGGSLAVHARVVCVAFLHYVRKLLAPVQLSPYYDLREGDLTAAGVVLGALLLALALTACAVLLLRRRPAGLLAAGALLMWLPASSALVPISTPIADRYLYLPLLFLGPLAARLAGGGPRARGGRVRPAAATGVLLLFTLLTVSQAAHWGSSRRLWERAVAVQPGNPYVRQKLAYTLWRAGDAVGALPHARRAVAIETRWLEGLETLGRVALDAGDAPAAEGAFRQQLGLAPNAVNAYLGVARARRSQGDDRGAFLAYLEALGLKRDLKAAAVELGEVAARNGWEEEALRRLPDRPTSVWIDLVRGDLLVRLDRLEEAEALWRRSLLTRPGFAPALERLGPSGSAGPGPARAHGKDRLTDPAFTD